MCRPDRCSGRSRPSSGGGARRDRCGGRRLLSAISRASSRTANARFERATRCSSLAFMRAGGTVQVAAASCISFHRALRTSPERQAVSTRNFGGECRCPVSPWRSEPVRVRRRLVGAATPFWCWRGTVFSGVRRRWHRRPGCPRGNAGKPDDDSGQGCGMSAPAPPELTASQHRSTPRRPAIARLSDHSIEMNFASLLRGCVPRGERSSYSPFILSPPSTLARRHITDERLSIKRQSGTTSSRFRFHS